MRLLWLAVTLTITGCASATFPVHDLESFAAPNSDATSATITTLYGDSPDGRLFYYNVMVDGKKVASVKNEQYVTFKVTAGGHKIGFKCPPLLNCPSIELVGDFEAGRGYYFFGTYGVDFAPRMGTGMTVTLNPINEARASNYLSRYAPGKLAP